MTSPGATRPTSSSPGKHCYTTRGDVTQFRVASLNKWSASSGRYKSQVPRSPDYAGRSHFLDFRATLIPTSNGRLVFRIISQHRPYDTSVFVGDGDDRPIDPATLAQRVDPPTERIGSTCRHANDSSCSVNKQGSQMLIPALADAQQHLSIAAGMLPWNQSHPCGEVSAVFELFAVADGGDYGGGCLWSDATDDRHR
ncbi:MAG: hypothetical protein FD119_1986 [Stygiobacter sp.]|nr:MAG: hypothetical protein FD119_1986 [Stygiobacter sp.]